MQRAKTLLFLVDLGQIGQGHLGKFDTVWPILFKFDTVVKHTESMNCAKFG
jgi:hypothetical protein